MKQYAKPIYAIGDIHGCKDLLVQLLAKIKEDALTFGEKRPRVIILGDMIDRGPDSRGVIELLMSQQFQDDYNSTELLGNHELMLLAVHDGDRENVMSWLHFGGAETIESYGVEFGGDSVPRVLDRFFSAFPQKHIAYLRGLPVSLRERDLFFVHAGVNPQNPIEQQSLGDLTFIREPFLSYTGNFGARIVHGHTKTKSYNVEVFPNRIAVDTGAGFPKGKLSAAVIEQDGTVRVLFSDVFVK